MSRKILFVGVFTPNSTNVAQARGFLDNSWETYAYDYRAKLREYSSAKSRDDDLIEKINEIQPHIILFSKCNMMASRVVDAANLIGSSVLWYMDGMNNFNIELIEKIKKVSYFVGGIEGVVQEAAKYNPNSEFIPQCPDDKMNYPLPDCDSKYDVTFIGNVRAPTGTHTDRQKYLDTVKFQHFENVHGLEHNLVVNQSKINLNFSHTSTEGTSVRLYKILAARGFLLTTPWKGMDDLFTPGKDFDIFTSPAELQEKIRYYLSNEDKREQIRTHGFNTVQKYMPKNWARTIISLVE